MPRGCILYILLVWLYLFCLFMPSNALVEPLSLNPIIISISAARKEENESNKKRAGSCDHHCLQVR